MCCLKWQCHEAAVVIKMGHSIERVFYVKNSVDWSVFFRNILGRICCPWWQCHEEAVICFHAEVNCNKPFLIVSLSRPGHCFRKTLQIFSQTSESEGPTHRDECVVARDVFLRRSYYILTVTGKFASLLESVYSFSCTAPGLSKLSTRCDILHPTAFVSWHLVTEFQPRTAYVRHYQSSLHT